jgi:hypothetical protein
MRGGNANIINQFYLLLNAIYPDIKTEEAWDNLKEKLILFPLYDVDAMKDLYQRSQGILMIPVDPTRKINKNDYQNRDSRLHLLWMNYVLSLPLNFQEETLEILDNFKNDRKRLAAWLSTLEQNNKDVDKLDYCDHIKRIINASRVLASRKVKDGKNYSSKGALMPYNIVVKQTITNLVMKEKGNSLYKCVKEMKRPPVAKKTEEKKENINELSPVKIDCFSDNENDLVFGTNS